MCMSAWEERAGGNGLRGTAPLNRHLNVIYFLSSLKDVCFIVKYSQLFTPEKCVYYVQVVGSDGEGAHEIHETDKHTGIG